MWLKVALSSGQTISFNYIFSLMFYDAHVKSVKHTGLVRCILRIDLSVVYTRRTTLKYKRHYEDYSQIEPLSWDTLETSQRRRILNRQTFKALPRCWTYQFTSLVSRFYEESALNVWPFNQCDHRHDAAILSYLLKLNVALISWTDSFPDLLDWQFFWSPGLTVFLISWTEFHARITDGLNMIIFYFSILMTLVD